MGRNRSESGLKYKIIFFLLMVIACAVGVGSYYIENGTTKTASTKTQNKDADINISSNSNNNAQNIIKEYAQKNGYNISDYPKSLINLLEHNSETKDFVLKYPENKDKTVNINLKKYKNSKKVPLLMQWDTRWGYTMYAGDVMGVSGCGPTCLSMVTIYLTGDTSKNPEWMARFAQENNYANEESGSEWALIYDGGAKLGLNVTQLPLDENIIINNLEQGNPIVCIMGPGDFTTQGHFIIMSEYNNGEITINDPNSKKNSDKKWRLNDISSQIKNLWVFEK